MIRRFFGGFVTRSRPGSKEPALPLAERNSVVLATHEAAAHAMQTGDSGGTIAVTASRDGDDAFIVHVRSDGAWEIAASDVDGSARSIIAGLMGDASTQASNTLRMRTLRQSA